MPIQRTVRLCAGALCLVLFGLLGGCQGARQALPDGHWAREAAAVAAERLRAAPDVVAEGSGQALVVRPAGRAPVSSPFCPAGAGADIPSPLPETAAVDRRGGEQPFLLAAQPPGLPQAVPVSPEEGPDVIFAATMPETSEETDAASGTPATQPAEARGPLPGFFETLVRDGKRTPRELWRDTKRVYTNTPNLIILGLAGAASIALHPEADHRIARHFDHHHIMTKDARSTFEILGNPGIHWAVAGTMYIASQQLQMTKEYEVARTLVSALIINDLSCLTLQVAAWQKDPSGRYFGWPSGHVTSTMTVAAVMHQASGPLAAAPLYGLTTFVAIERLDDKDHWLSDVIFGGALGWVVGHTVAGGRLPEIGGGEIVPYVDPLTGSAGVAWWKSL